ncbi:hypothetical protein [Variovorax soli]|uniref:Ni,Fe-hydrogenase III small subunit n=1 Tax=Variovorax soli TaxID=376815 RepID=A0ABU1NDF1_9BURK|nr:hypothetical protein [Variovorax soli]MDR6536368.1 Ni,Fe-hydrogenase III small subunit [Variovorax soli]
MESVENLEQTETGPRHVIQGTYQGTRIEVIAGYSIDADEWLFHVYLHHSQGHADRLTELPTSHRANSLQDAFDQGLKLAMSHLTSK